MISKLNKINLSFWNARRDLETESSFANTKGRWTVHRFQEIFALHRRIDFEDAVTLEIDKKPQVDASTYTVYAGLEMSPEELDFNRRRQR